ncbi:D-amino acid dehydrogenase small subunit [Hydrogenophaga crassostreae]|uniref:D-amino acid dehydrogenase n=1 Tax=Hydrogenophaga crassostreae TaxID=1763535 RepID=A0A163CJY1_9BURK|nr:D-amino acid dehydrogenase [Hydrogenophaga crassostreae]AOW15727.1 D-amino acid dehydrogenase small subunit [Hydrogenophaga crassostreae]OAD42923.1 D-amino acid dehydrogenase small subunit [Hydrogenophaga crassostreae]
MNILILGSGVIGTTTAYYLAKAGHQVTVVERQPGPALETSHANAGEVSPGYSAPWAGPGVPMKAVKWMLMHHSPLVVWPMLDMAMWRWGAQMLRNCTEARYRTNKGRMVRLAEYSRDCLAELRTETGIQYDQRTQGTLQLFRTQKQVDGTGKDIEILQQYGVPFEVLDREGYCRYEPALALVKEKFVGALRLPGDETGDCFKFTQGIAERAAELGVQFRFDTSIDGIETSGGKFTGVRTSAGTLTADACLVALGSYSPMMLKPLGIDIPVYPVKGYSITVPITDAAGAPESTIMDETHKVAVTRLGDRIRVGGTAELAGFSTKLREARRDTLNHVVSDLFPTGGDVSKAEFWCGLRPMTPDGTPVLGGTHVNGLYLATGHGTLGWTMAAGTGRVMADLISGRPTDIDMSGLTVERYQPGRFDA